jgi:hypothetical protein
MTVLEASIKLYEWFLVNDSFSDTGKDFIKLMEISDTPDEDKAAYYCALKELLDQKMISLHDGGEDQRVWVLQRDLSQCDQEIKINYLTAMQLSHVVNTFCEVMDNKQNKCNPSQISEEDIRSLIFINQTLSEDSSEGTSEPMGGLLPPI